MFWLLSDEDRCGFELVPVLALLLLKRPNVRTSTMKSRSFDLQFVILDLLM